MFSFFDSAIIILLINSNFTGEKKLESEKTGLLWFLFDGSYTDFSDEWFADLSFFFISPLYLETIAPLTGELYEYCWFLFWQLLDRNFTPKKLYKTKESTPLAYADLYSGPETAYDEKYPRLMNIVFVSMFYGFSMPFFFVLCLGCFIVSYYVEKFVACFHYKKPPMYDDTLSNTTVYYLKWGGDRKSHV